MPNPESESSRSDQRSVLERIARAAMLERGFLPDFPRAVERELARITPGPSPLESEAKDLRDLPWVSIDNEDSRDIDQLTAVEAARGSSMRVLVAVADVASTVRSGSAIDLHAGHNTTSVYTVPRVFPMLPLELSTDRTSLNAGRDRLAVVTAFEVDPRGGIGASEVFAARVRNRVQLAYPEVGVWLEGDGPAPRAVAGDPVLKEQLRLADEVARLLEERRNDEGALEFELRAPHAVYEDGQVTAIVREAHNRATKLIEHFMIAANSVIAKHLSTHGLSIERVVAKPKNWPRLREVAARFGERLPPQPDGVLLGQFLARRRRAAPEAFPDLSLVVIKLLGRGEYVVGSDAGHFGLGLEDYLHSTAPNRRYPDLVTQRILLASLAGARPPYDANTLGAIAAHCTEKEADADRVERRVRKSAAALFLRKRIGERFDAIVTGVSESGTWVRIKQPPVEGMLHGQLGDLNVGHGLRVELVRTDVERGYIDFQPI